MDINNKDDIKQNNKDLNLNDWEDTTRDGSRPGVNDRDVSRSDVAMIQEITDKHGNKGVLIRNDKGHFLPGTVGTNTINSGAHGRDLAARRIELGRQAAARGLRSAAEKSGRVLPGQGTGAAWGAVVESVALALFEADKLSGQSEVLRALGQAAGILPSAGAFGADLGASGGGLPDLLGASGGDIDVIRLLIVELKRS